MTGEAGAPRGAAAWDVRRRDRAKDDAWIRAYLRAAPYGVLATVSDGRPFVNSNLFVYDGSAHALYLHTARRGRTRVNATGGIPAAFTATTMGRLLPAAEALEFSVEYSGVVVFGSLQVVEAGREAEAALQKLLSRYFPDLEPGRDYRPITPDELRRTSVYRLDVEGWSGKEKSAADDFPGARWMTQLGVPFRQAFAQTRD